MLQSEETPVAMETEMEVVPEEPVQVEEAESTTTSPTAIQPASPDVSPVVEAPPEEITPPLETTEEPELEPETAPKEPTPEPEEPPTPPKPKIEIIVKTPKEKQVIQVEEGASIKDIKVIVGAKFNADPDYLCLIFAGKMMEDEDTLEMHNVHEGMTIHLIIKAAPRESEAGAQRPPADITKTPFGIGAIGGLVGLESLGMGSAHFMELQNRMQTELLGNPELLRRVLENPLVQSLMKDTDNMKYLIRNNPQMRDLMSRHPEIRQMLNNTELLKHTSELAKNPSMLQELMRNLDGTNPMEGTTTFTTLPTMFTTFQEPAISSMTSKMQEAQKSEPGNLFNNPQMSSLLQQMVENPQAMQNMLQAPYTQTVLQALQADPTMSSAIINENPLFKNNPALQQHLTSMMPQLLQQLQNPEVLNMVASPQAINALLQIQEGLDNLKNVAPGLVSNLGLGSFNDFTGSTDASTSQADSSGKPASEANFSKFMSLMVEQMSNSDPKLPPVARYKLQMEHLKLMGFTEEEENLQTLTAVFGDVNAAVQKLLAKNKVN